MANNEELSENSNYNGLDSFDAVKQRFKDRSKVTSDSIFTIFDVPIC